MEKNVYSMLFIEKREHHMDKCPALFTFYL